MLGGSVGNKAGWVRDSVDLLVEEAGWECSQVEVGAVREKCISSVQQCLKVSEGATLISTHLSLCYLVRIYFLTVVL